MHTQIKHALLVFAAVTIALIVTIVYRIVTKKEIVWMDKKYFYLFNHAIDGWVLSHFIMYLMLGFVAPNYWCIILLWGVFFEYVEKILGNVFSLPIYSNITSDPIVNTAGYIVGFTLQHVFKCKKQIK